MRKALSIIITLILLFSLSACSSTPVTDKDSSKIFATVQDYNGGDAELKAFNVSISPLTLGLSSLNPHAQVEVGSGSINTDGSFTLTFA